jgi:hypothetical protein
MSKTKWNKGAPPSIGWWPAGYFQDTALIRWYDGTHWSISAYASFTAEEAANCAFYKAADQGAVEWTERWWL